MNRAEKCLVTCVCHCGIRELRVLLEKEVAQSETVEVECMNRNISIHTFCRVTPKFAILNKR
jgi:hypothetical protein